MTVSHSKKSTSASKSHPKPPETAETKAPEVAATSGPDTAETSANGAATATSGAEAEAPAAQPTITVAQAVTQLVALEKGLALNIAALAGGAPQVRSISRVTNVALNLAAEIVSADPVLFAGFASLPGYVATVNKIEPLEAQVTSFATHVTKNATNARLPAAQQTQALYQVVKGYGRLPDNEILREKIPLLRAELAPEPKNPKPKATPAEKTAKRAAKAHQKKVDAAKALLQAEAAKNAAIVAAAQAALTAGTNGTSK